MELIVDVMAAKLDVMLMHDSVQEGIQVTPGSLSDISISSLYPQRPCFPLTAYSDLFLSEISDMCVCARERESARARERGSQRSVPFPSL